PRPPDRTRIGLPAAPPPSRPTARPAARPAAVPPRPYRSRTYALAAVAVLLLLVAGLLAYLASRPDDPGTNARGGSSTPNTPATGTSAEPGTTQQQRTETRTEPQQPPQTTEPPQPAPVTAENLSRAVEEYYQQLPDNLDEGWDRLGPNLRAVGYDSYTGFWSRFSRVDAQVQDANAEAMTVRVVVVHHRDGEAPIAELHELTLVRDGERLLIDKDRRLGPAEVPGGGEGEGDG
ncbi:MAG TPA: hypothetical protein VGD67_22655, partial [Pseudonocardiaceae bacterium]